MRALIYGGGVAVLAALVALAASQAPLGTPLFYLLAAVPGLVYGLLVRRLLFPQTEEPEHPARTTDPTNRRLLVVALVFAGLFRLPLAVPRVGADNDMVRYLYDGRVQRLGYNPFTIIPSAPEVSATHTDETRRMPSLRARTPYPAAAQLFFRLVVSVRESSRAMKVALILCDLLTIGVLLRWLQETERSPWLALIYAWNPLVILEVAHSGHIDALGALWIAVAAWMLSTGRPLRAVVAFTLAVATKLLPVVLVPLFWRRIRIRDAAAGAVLLILLYLPFAGAGTVALGNVPNVVAGIRFNGPAFRAIARASAPSVAAGAAVLAGLLTAAFFRARTTPSDPAAWAWPMAASLLMAPVIYPWYLLYYTPFLATRRALPLLVWTYSVMLAYLVWAVPSLRRPWVVPPLVLLVEFGAVAATCLVPLLRPGRRRS